MKILDYIKYGGIVLLIAISVFMSIGVYSVYTENKRIKAEIQVYKQEIDEIRKEYLIYQKNLEAYNDNIEKILEKTRESKSKIQKTITRIKAPDVTEEEKLSSFNETNRYLLDELSRAGK